MAQEHLHEFLTPMASSGPDEKWPSVANAQQPKQPPDSPSKLLARNRLGNLLGQIRKGGTKVTAPGVEGVHGRVVVVSASGQQLHEIEEVDDIDSEFGGRHGERLQRQHGRRMRREKRVVFELRGKAFGLRDSGQAETVYALCRKWMYGRDEEAASAEDNQQQKEDEEEEQREEGEGGGDEPRRPFALGATGGDGTTHRSLDLLATKDIYALPPPRADAPPLLDPRPQRLIRRAVDSQATTQQTDNGRDKQMDDKLLLDEHMKHWKRVKQNWREYGRKREQRYADSLQLLRTVYGIAQQTQQI